MFPSELQWTTLNLSLCVREFSAAFIRDASPLASVHHFRQLPVMISFFKMASDDPFCLMPGHVSQLKFYASFVTGCSTIDLFVKCQIKCLWQKGHFTEPTILSYIAFCSNSEALLKHRAAGKVDIQVWHQLGS